MDTTISDPLVGVLLDGRYRVDRRVARGGMATVYTAVDTRLDREVAVKVMHAGLAEDEAFVARFIREAKSAARLAHPDVVAVFDQGSDAGRVFLVMEYVAGRTLRDLLQQRGRLAPAEAVAILEPVLAALAAAHRAGLVHRDVKPENVLLADDGRVKVADFGLVRAVEASTLTASGVLIGTAAYLAPEQVSTGGADARSDVYAAGILLSEMLTGAPPYQGETPIAVAYQHVHADVPPPSDAVADVPGQLDQLVLRATRRDPGQRPADAGAFLAEVRRARREMALERPDLAETVAVRRDEHHPTLVEPRPTAPPPATGPGPARTRRHRRRGLIALVLIVVLGLLAGAAGWWFGSGRYVDAPSFVGLTQTAATAKAENAGFDVAVVSQRHSEKVPSGQVLAQDPKPDHPITRGGTIRLTMSLGPERYPVPGDIVGKTVAQATAMITAAHLKVAPTAVQQYADSAAGIVLGSDPHTGTPQRPGTVVTLVVSKGPPPVDVPNVVGKTLDDATNALKVNGLNASSTEAFSDEVAKGHVISQDPPAGTAHRGDTVALVVSKGPDIVTVPAVTGKSEHDAVALLKQAGLKPQVRSLPGGPGRVLEQRPGAGAKVKRGDTVTLYVF